MPLDKAYKYTSQVMSENMMALMQKREYLLSLRKENQIGKINDFR